MINFSDLGVSDAVVRALGTEGIGEPMPIQAEALQPLTAGQDAYICAPTGTGKTLAYLLPIVARTDLKLPQAQAIILAPTHELASQIHQQALTLMQQAGMPLRSMLLIGGANTKRQLEKLKKKPHLIVGSTGRVLELIHMKKLKVQAVSTIVLDEADRLLVGESLADVLLLLKTLSKKPQLVFVSATEPASALEEARRLAPELISISAGTNQVNADIRHLYFICEERSKADLLRRLIRATEPERAMVFVHRNNAAELVKEKMEHYGISVADLHGARGKLARQQAMDQIRNGKVQVLIASDVAARGLDIRAVTHVFNYDAPTSSRDYLHRVGRTGRAGATGYALTLLTPQEVRLAERYAQELKIKMVEAAIREGTIFDVNEERKS